MEGFSRVEDVEVDEKNLLLHKLLLNISSCFNWMDRYDMLERKSFDLIIQRNSIQDLYFDQWKLLETIQEKYQAKLAAAIDLCDSLQQQVTEHFPSDTMKLVVDILREDISVLNANINRTKEERVHTAEWQARNFGKLLALEQSKWLLNHPRNNNVHDHKSSKDYIELFSDLGLSQLYDQVVGKREKSLDLFESSVKVPITSVINMLDLTRELMDEVNHLRSKLVSLSIQNKRRSSTNLSLIAINTTNNTLHDVKTLRRSSSFTHQISTGTETNIDDVDSAIKESPVSFPSPTKAHSHELQISNLIRLNESLQIMMQDSKSMIQDLHEELVEKNIQISDLMERIKVLKSHNFDAINHEMQLKSRIDDYINEGNKLKLALELSKKRESHLLEEKKFQELEIKNLQLNIDQLKLESHRLESSLLQVSQREECLKRNLAYSDHQMILHIPPEDCKFEKESFKGNLTLSDVKTAVDIPSVQGNLVLGDVQTSFDIPTIDNFAKNEPLKQTLTWSDVNNSLDIPPKDAKLQKEISKPEALIDFNEFLSHLKDLESENLELCKRVRSFSFQERSHRSQLLELTEKYHRFESSHMSLKSDLEIHQRETSSSLKRLISAENQNQGPVLSNNTAQIDTLLTQNSLLRENLERKENNFHREISNLEKSLNIQIDINKDLKRKIIDIETQRMIDVISVASQTSEEKPEIMEKSNRSTPVIKNVKNASTDSRDILNEQMREEKTGLQDVDHLVKGYNSESKIVRSKKLGYSGVESFSILVRNETGSDYPRVQKSQETQYSDYGNDLEVVEQSRNRESLKSNLPNIEKEHNVVKPRTVERSVQTREIESKESQNDARIMKLMYGAKLWKDIKAPSKGSNKDREIMKGQFFECIERNFIRILSENRDLQQRLIVERDKVEGLRKASSMPTRVLQPKDDRLWEASRRLSSLALEHSSLIDPSMMTVIIVIQKLLDSLLVNDVSSSSSSGIETSVLDEILPSILNIIGERQRYGAMKSSYSVLRRQIMYFYNLYRKTFAQSREERKFLSDERLRLESLVTHLSKSVQDKKRQFKEQHEKHLKRSQTLMTSCQSQIYDEDEKLSLAFFMEDQKRFAYSYSKNVSFIEEINEFMMQDELDGMGEGDNRRWAVGDYRDAFGIQTVLNRDLATANESIRKTQSFLSIFQGLD